MVRCFSAALSLVLLGCSASSTPAARVALEPSTTVEIVRVVSAPPTGGDGPEIVELAITRGGARLTVPRAIGGVAFGDAALVLLPDRSLARLTGEPDGVAAIDTAVDFVPVVSPSGDVFAYARSDDGLAHALIVEDAQGARILADGLASIGALHFVDGERLVFVGARSGGVAGLWIVRTTSDARASCLTNCALRTGQPWGDAFVPPPTDLGSLRLDGDGLHFVDANGQARTAGVALP
jgi:hypothetical protein